MSAPTTGQPADIPDHLPAIAPPIGPAVDVLAAWDADIDTHERRILNGELTLRAYDDVNRKREARAAVAELIETARRAEVSFNTVRGCYERNPGNFAVAMRELEADVIPLRAALARVGGAA